MFAGQYSVIKNNVAGLQWRFTILSFTLNFSELRQKFLQKKSEKDLVFHLANRLQK